MKHRVVKSAQPETRKRASAARRQSATRGGSAAKAFPIVGIGASAGGLDAFKKLFSAMPDESGLAFVLIQHLDPTRASLTADLVDDSDRDADVDTDGNVDRDADVNTDGDVDGDSDVDTDGDVDCDAGVNTDGDVDGDSDRDADVDTDRYAGSRDPTDRQDDCFECRGRCNPGLRPELQQRGRDDRNWRRAQRGGSRPHLLQRCGEYGGLVMPGCEPTRDDLHVGRRGSAAR